MFSALDIVTVADETELDVERVAAVHFRLGSRLGLHWLQDQIVALPRDDRWRAAPVPPCATTSTRSTAR